MSCSFPLLYSKILTRVISVNSLGAQQSYFALALQREDPEDTVSEFEYRGDILAQFNIGGFEAQAVAPLLSTEHSETGDPCKDVPNLVKNVLPGIDTFVDATLVPLSIPDAIKTIIKTAIGTAKGALEKIGLGDISDVAFGAVHTALSAVVSALKMAIVVPLVGPLISRAVDYITPVLQIFESVRGCDKSKIAIEPATCGDLADIYRAGVNSATRASLPPAMPTARSSRT